VSWTRRRSFSLKSGVGRSRASTTISRGVSRPNFGSHVSPQLCHPNLLICSLLLGDERATLRFDTAAGVHQQSMCVGPSAAQRRLIGKGWPDLRAAALCVSGGTTKSHNPAWQALAKSIAPGLARSDTWLLSFSRQTPRSLNMSQRLFEPAWHCFLPSRYRSNKGPTDQLPPLSCIPGSRVACAYASSFLFASSFEEIIARHQGSPLSFSDS
jgi:hypothetical protein